LERILQAQSAVGQAPNSFPDAYHDIRTIWSDDLFYQLWSKFYPTGHISETIIYFLNDIDRLNPSLFVPSTNDHLRLRKKTTGITEVVMTIDQEYKFYDFAGAMQERKKWRLKYADTDVVMFFVSLIDYDKICDEDLETSRLEDSQRLWETVLEQFQDKTIFLIFNKYDLLVEKLASKNESMINVKKKVVDHFKTNARVKTWFLDCLDRDAVQTCIEWMVYMMHNDRNLIGGLSRDPQFTDVTFIGN
jgi:GTPase SAR1 family protein